MQLFRRADHRVVPWKNGRGTTTEIAVHPPGATLQGGFDWRLSMATIDEDGPFSSFPGVDRTLVLLDGALDLVSPEGTERLTRFGLAAFPGEREVRGRLRGGPVHDLNVMVRRAAFTHDAVVVRVAGPADLGTGRPLLVIALEGAPSVGGFPLLPGEALAVDGSLSADGDGTVLVARLAPRLE